MLARKRLDRPGSGPAPTGRRTVRGRRPANHTSRPPPHPSGSARGMCAVGIFTMHTSRGHAWERRVLRTRASRPQRIGGPGASTPEVRMRARRPRSQDATFPSASPRKRCRGVKPALSNRPDTLEEYRSRAKERSRLLLYFPMSIGYERRTGSTRGGGGAGPQARRVEPRTARLAADAGTAGGFRLAPTPRSAPWPHFHTTAHRTECAGLPPPALG